jgi:hypothetical protein
MRSGKFRSKRKLKVVKMLTKKAVTKIVKSTVKSNQESKYFDTKSLQSAMAFHRARSNVLGIGVRGFATCEDKNSQGTRVQYGVDSSNAHQYLTELNMNRTFAPTDPDNVSANAVVGHYCNPSLAKSEFIIERDFIQTADDGSSYTTLNVAPYYVRVLRITPNAKKLSTTEIDPENDAFINELGQETGVADSNFGPHELMMYLPNKRKYRVIADTKCTLVPPFVTTEVAQGGAAGASDALVTNLQKSGFMKRMTMKHNIGKKLYFEDGANTGGNSTAGQQNEFILFHTCQIGVDSQSSLLGNSALNALISGKFVSTFKDP